MRTASAVAVCAATDFEGDRQFAEDVVQESMLRLWRKPVLEQPSESVRAWLFTVARNLVIDDRRSARYNRELQTEFMPERQSPDAIGPAFDKWILSDALMSLSADHRFGHRPGLLSRPNRRRHRCARADPTGHGQIRLHYALRALRIALQERGLFND